MSYKPCNFWAYNTNALSMEMVILIHWAQDRATYTVCNTYRDNASFDKVKAGWLYWLFRQDWIVGGNMLFWLTTEILIGSQKGCEM